MIPPFLLAGKIARRKRRKPLTWLSVPEWLGASVFSYGFGGRKLGTGFLAKENNERVRVPSLEHYLEYLGISRNQSTDIAKMADFDS